MQHLGLARTVSLTVVLVPATLVMALTACGGERPAGDTTAAAGGSPLAQASADADFRDLSQYELTMDKMDRYLAATRNMLTAAKNLTPEQRERLKASGDANASLDDYAAQLESEPVARDAIRRAGLSTKEFAVISMAYIQAAMAQAILQMRPDIKNTDSIAGEMKANPANLKFVNENKAALEAKFKALESEMKAAGLDQ
jgi:hypothetical protein